MGIEILQTQIDCLRERLENLVAKNDDLTKIKIIKVSQRLDELLNLYYEALLDVEKEENV